MRRTTLSLHTAIIAIGLALSGCGQETENSEVGPSEAQPQAAPEVEAVTEPVVSTIQQEDVVAPNATTALTHDPDDAGEDLYQRGFYAEALEQWRVDAEAGSAYAAYRLGVEYLDAQHVERDLEMSARYHQLASELGHPASMFELATMYEDGRGVPPNLETAAEWYVEAARRGFPPAQHNAATLYEEGVGVEQSLVQAFVYYSLAIEQGFRVNFVRDEETGETVFVDPRDRLREMMTPEELDSAEEAVAVQLAAD